MAQENLPENVTGQYPDYHHEPLSVVENTRWRMWRFDLVETTAPEKIIKTYPIIWGFRKRHQPPLPDELDMYRNDKL